MGRRPWQKVLTAAKALPVLALLHVALPAYAQTPPKMEIQLFSSEFGGVFYLIGQGFSELINKNCPWLASGSLETHGSIDNVKREADIPEKRARTLRGVTASVVWPAKLGQAPLFDKKYDLKMLFTFGIAFSVFATTDPNIKTVNDFKGKKVGVGDKGSSFNSEVRFMLQDCTNIWDTIKPEWLSHVPASNAFMDGMIDVMYTPVFYFGGDKFMIHPQTAEALRMKKVYLLGITAEELEQGKKKTGWPASRIVMPAGALPERVNRDQPILSWVNTLGYGAYADMDEKVAYEIVKIAHQNMLKFAGFHACTKVMSPEVMAWLPVASEQDVHPGALKYYKEQGIKISVGGRSPLN